MEGTPLPPPHQAHQAHPSKRPSCAPGEVHDPGAGEVHVAHVEERGEPARAPAPGHDHGVDEASSGRAWIASCDRFFPPTLPQATVTGKSSKLGYLGSPTSASRLFGAGARSFGVAFRKSLRLKTLYPKWHLEVDGTKDHPLPNPGSLIWSHTQYLTRLTQNRRLETKIRGCFFFLTQQGDIKTE